MSTFDTPLGLAGSGRANRPERRRRRVGRAARLTLAAMVGLVVGAVTELSVPHLPFALEPLANTAAPWVLVAFAVALTARWMSESLVLAVMCLVALVVGFYVAEALRGWQVSRQQVEFWSAASVLIGPLIGLAAGWIRHAGRAAGAVGAGVLGGLLVGEALHGLTALRFSSSAGYWDMQFALGVSLTVGVTLWRCRGRRLASLPALAVGLAACAVVALGTLIIYHVP
jgi:hypothetical protein